MARQTLITGLDIGTQNIKVLVVNQKDKELEVFYRAQESASGIRRGVVINPEEASNILRGIFDKIKQDTGAKIHSVYVNIDGSHLFSNSSRGLISVSRADQKISEEDIQRVLQAAQAISLPSNKEIFDAIAKEFIIDGQGGIKEPLGLQGVRLEAEVLVLGGFSPYLKNLAQTVLDSDLGISDIVPSPIAAARACLSEKQKELGVAMADIGAGTTGLAVFEEGNLIHFSVLPMGSANITNDIAVGLKIDIDIAERIKLEYGTCLAEKSQKREKIEVGEEEPLVFSPKQLAGIIEVRVSEIFGEINKELKKISREKLLPAGIVLTGGGVKLPKIVQLAKKELKLPCKIGKPEGIPNLNDPIFATCCGLVMGGTDIERKEKIFEFGKGLGSKIKKIFKIFIP